MGKIIIIIEDEISDERAVSLVASVIKCGKISRDEKSYCAATVFYEGTVVEADVLKSGTNKFFVYQDKKIGNLAKK